MKRVIQLSFTFFCVLWTLSSQLNAQQVNMDNIKPADKDRKWSVSFSLNARISETREGMMNAMEDEGYDNSHTTSWYFLWLLFSSTTDYPNDAAKGVDWDMEVRRKISPYASLALTYAKSPTLTTNGHNVYGQDHHHFLSLETSNALITCDYVFTLKNSYTGFKMGPVLGIHRISEYSSDLNQGKTTTLKPGLHIGFDAALFEKKSWFMAFSMDYNWMTPVTIGPYADEVYVADHSKPATYTSVFGPVDIPLSSLKIGLTTGWKF